MNFERIIFVREMLDLSQRQIAEKLNVSKSTYARWETGEKIIPIDHLTDLCNYSKYTIDYILSLTDNKQKLKDDIILNYKTIGLKIKSIRMKAKLTQQEFASSINTTQSVISNYENGNVQMETSFLYNICIKYNVSANWLIN